jgi:hypothetical protein
LSVLLDTARLVESRRSSDAIWEVPRGVDRAVPVQGAARGDRVPPQLAPAKLVQYMKGRSSQLFQDEFPQLRKRYWGQHLWARGYFCASVGAVDEETIHKYSESRQGEDPGENFKITAPNELKTALRREPCRRLQPQTGDFQSQSNLSAFRRYSFSFTCSHNYILAHDQRLGPSSPHSCSGRADGSKRPA